jgi:hypothetical protein
MSVNPFTCDGRVEPTAFFNRETALRKTAGGLVAGGQSTLITGEPRTGKTSLLSYLMAEEKRQELYPEPDRRMLFSYVDIDALGSEPTAAGFWEQVWAPVEESLARFSSSSSVIDALNVCRAHDYSIRKVERLLRLLEGEGLQMVLLVDEMDHALHHDGLRSIAFLAGLRVVVGHGSGAFAVVLASRLSQRELDVQTRVLSSVGSPFFNVYRPVTLGPFPAKHVEALLDQAGDRFSVADRALIRTVGGGHPFLIQATALVMWEAYDLPIDDADERHLFVRQQVYHQHSSLFADTWKNWTPEKRKTFTTLALAYTSHLLPERPFLSDGFVADLRDYSAELDELDEAGHILGAAEVLGGWRVASEAMLWWLTDELASVVHRATLYRHSELSGSNSLRIP